jgi:arsenate reductase
MATRYTIYHNPSCSKSRATLELLSDHNITPTVVEYLNEPPSIQMLADILTVLDAQPRDIMRTKEAAYTQQNLASMDLSATDLINAIIRTPILLERPIVIKQDDSRLVAAAIGRPPENILALL